MSRALRIKLLGSLQVKVGEDTAVFRTDAERTLLAYLAAHQGKPQRRDTLAGLLSPDRPDKEALTYLRNRLTRLRKVIGDDEANPPWLEIDRKQIALRNGRNIVVDVSQFEQHLTAVEAHAHRQLAGCPTCLARLEEAVELVDGELLAGLNFPSEPWQAWLLAQREHVQQRALEAMTWLREAMMVQGEWTAVLDIAQRQLNFEPWLEAAHRAMMLAQYQLGDRNAALAQFEQCQQLLWDELGVEPEEETNSLFATVKSAAALPTLPQPAAVPHNLPVQTGTFFGREAEQAQLLLRLVDPNYRLVTLVGTGGIGKTRLAIEVGGQVKMSFPDGVWFVPLEAIKGDAEQIKIAVGEAIGFGQDEKQLTGEQVLAILRDKQLLFIFDNSEVALEAIAFIPEWLRRAPHIAILATSREPLNFAAESVVMLDGLPVGEAEMNAAEALFAERGGMARSDFAVTAVNLPQVRHICQLVNGSPLAITLAATWVRRRSLPQIIKAIDQSLDFLSTRLRDVDPRHRSMRAVFETSWQMLSAEEMKVLAALAIFPASFTVAAAAEVAGATLFVLDALCDKSLVQQEQESERYALHSLVRQFAAQKLGDERTAVGRRFARYYFNYAKANQTDYARLQPEWRNLAEGIATAHSLAQWQQVLDFVAQLDEPWFNQIRFHDMRQGLQLGVEAAHHLQAQPARARLLLRLGQVDMEINEYEAADAHLAEAMRLMMHLEDSLGIANAKFFYGRIKLELGAAEEAQTLLNEARRIFQEEKNSPGVAKSLNILALFHLTYTSDLEAASRHLEKSVSYLRPLSPSATYVEALRYLGRVKGILGEHDQAEQCLREAANISLMLQDLGEHAAVLFERIILCRRQDQVDEALEFANACLEQFQKLGSLRWEALVKTQLAILHQAKQRLPLALSLFKESVAIFTELGDLYEQAYGHYYLYRLYAETENLEKSSEALQRARLLNAQINDPQLAERLT